MRVSKKKVVSLAAAGLLAVSLVGCGSTPVDTYDLYDPDDPGTGSETAEEQATPGAKKSSAEVTQATFVDLVGASQESATTMHMETTYSGAAAEAAGITGVTMPTDVDVSDPESPRMSMSMNAEGTELSMIVVDGTYYLSMGELTEGKYIKASLDEMMDDPMMGSFQSMSGSADPKAQLEGFGDAIVSFEASGSDTVDGTDVDLYTLVLDPTKVTGPQIEQLDPEMVEALGGMTVVYALDETDRPLRVEVTMVIEGKSLVSTSVFSRWGEDLDIEAPPADQIFEQ
ncbi:hypothetical protein ACFT2C_24140 [Promicromonospora sp. NPDC057138]|uniref:hypothetical protein n=1 Tax=Promicromonospora sp. NPDC057138 TaxID=3346031 RepID=UPI003629C691